MKREPLHIKQKDMPSNGGSGIQQEVFFAEILFRIKPLRFCPAYNASVPWYEHWEKSLCFPVMTQKIIDAHDENK